MKEEIIRCREHVKEYPMSNKKLSIKTNVPFHFINDLTSGMIEKGTSPSYKRENTIKFHIKALERYMKNYFQAQDRKSVV